MSYRQEIVGPDVTKGHHLTGVYATDREVVCVDGTRLFVGRNADGTLHATVDKEIEGCGLPWNMGTFRNKDGLLHYSRVTVETMLVALDRYGGIDMLRTLGWK